MASRPTLFHYQTAGVGKYFTDADRAHKLGGRVRVPMYARALTPQQIDPSRLGMGSECFPATKRPWESQAVGHCPPGHTKRAVMKNGQVVYECCPFVYPGPIGTRPKRPASKAALRAHVERSRSKVGAFGIG